MSFKIGDLVVCFENFGCNGLTIGKIYTVTKIDSCGDPYVVCDEGDNQAYMSRRFRLKRSIAERLSPPAINPEKLLASIEKMTSVCAKGKEEIKTMLAEGFGIEFPQPSFTRKDLKTGQYFKRPGVDCIYMFIDGLCFATLACIDGSGQRWSEGPSDKFSDEVVKWVNNGEFVQVFGSLKFTEKKG